MPAVPSVRIRETGPDTRTLLACAAGAAMVVLVLWVTVAAYSPDAADRRVYGWFHGTRGTTETAFARHLTAIGDGVPLIAILVALGALARLIWGRWEPLAVTALAVTLGGATSTVVKHIAGRDRPPRAGWMSDAAGTSFPSGHTTVATAGYLALAATVAVVATSPRARAAVLTAGAALAASIGWTRIELGVHWPTDVLAGWAVGTGAACAALACWRPPPTLRS